MDDTAVKALMAEIAPVVRDFVEASTAPIVAENKRLVERVTALEARKPEKGDPGEKGDAGLQGEDGIGMAGALINRAGNLVISLSDGTQHDLGPVIGKDGRDGKDGEQGPLGPQGEPGPQGPQGALGPQGGQGETGSQGDKGDPGQDGSDGLSVTAATVNAEGELELQLSNGETQKAGLVIGPRGEIGEKGDSGPEGPPAYVGEARGLFDPAAEYRARDVIALNGSAFMAKTDNPGECPGEGWMLLAQRGKRGDKGDRGERGNTGMNGKDGATPVALAIDADNLEFRMILDNGEECAADFYPIAKAIRGE